MQEKFFHDLILMFSQSLVSDLNVLSFHSFSYHILDRIHFENK